MSTELSPPTTTAAPAVRPAMSPIAKWISVWFGCGLSPVGPGTMGTIGAIPLAYALSLGGTAVFVAGLIVVTAVGTWAAENFVRATGVDDDQRIVVDEVAGYLLTIAAVPKTVGALLLGFVLFRLFDIWKPQPVKWVDHNVGGGLGVMADDLAAAVYAGIGLLLCQHFGAVHWLNQLFGVAG